MALIEKENLKANILKMLGISGEEYLLPAERALWNVIEEEPPVQPNHNAEVSKMEIIHCRECKHNPQKEWFSCPMAHLDKQQRPEDAWCWKGEREAE